MNLNLQNVLRKTLSAWNQTSPPQRSGKNHLPEMLGEPPEQKRPVPLGQHHRGNFQLPQLRLEGKREIFREERLPSSLRKTQSGYAEKYSAKREDFVVF